MGWTLNKLTRDQYITAPLLYVFSLRALPPNVHTYDHQYVRPKCSTYITYALHYSRRPLCTSHITRKSILIWEKVQYCSKRKARRPMVSMTGHRCFWKHAPPTCLLFIVWRFSFPVRLRLYSLTKNGKISLKFFLYINVNTISDVIMLIWHQFDQFDL